MRRPIILTLIALAVIVTAVPGAAARHAGSAQARQGDCGPPAGGTLPTVTSVTVDGVAIPGSKPGMGKLYYSMSTGNGQLDGTNCLYPWDLRIERDYTGAGPQSGWFSVVGTAPWFLDHAAFAQKFNPAYTDQPAVTESTKIVATIQLPSDGSYAAQNAYWFTTNGRLEGSTGISLNGNTLTVTGYPRANVNTPEQWPNGLPPDYNALAVDASTYYAQFGGLDSWGNGQANGYGDSGQFGPGGPIAQVSTIGLQFSVRARFAATLGKGSEEQRGMWFEATNTPRWSFMYSNQGGGPRTESGSTTPVVATTTPVAGVGIVVDIGTVPFSSPNYTAKKNKAVQAKVRGRKVALTFKLTAKQVKAAKGRVTVLGGTKKLRKVGTFAVRKGRNTVSVAFIKKGGYVVKAGRAVIGSATVR